MIRTPAIEAAPLSFFGTVMVIFDNVIFAPSTLNMRVAKMPQFDFYLLVTMTNIECRW